MGAEFRGISPDVQEVTKGNYSGSRFRATALRSCNPVSCWAAAEQSRQFLDAARGDRLESLYVLAITTGMRLGELLRLRWREVDLDARVVSIRGGPQGKAAPDQRWSARGGRSC
jgi:hypothetical protein